MAGGVFFGAWYGGFGPGLVATFLAVLACAYFLIPPFPLFTVTDPSDVFQLALFALIGVTTSFLAHVVRGAEERARELLTRERVARAESERRASRLARLQAASAELSQALTPSDVATVVFREVL